jgi:hypothetical protein
MDLGSILYHIIEVFYIIFMHVYVYWYIWMLANVCMYTYII